MTPIDNAPNVPAAIGPYSQAMKCGCYLFCSGQIPVDPATGKIEASDIEGQTRQVLANITALLAAEERRLSDVIKTTLFLTDLADFPKVNALYAEAFGDHKPARSTIQVAALPLGARVEMEVIVDLGADACCLD